jgi:hypothetical protein
MKFIIYNPKTHLFDFFIDALSYTLNTYIYDQTYLYDYNNDIILILINPHFIYDYKDIYNEIININKLFKFKILYITEPINFLIEKKVYLDIIKLIKPYRLWTYTVENFNKLNTYIPIYRVFPKYNESYNFINNDNNTVRNTDNIIFFGNITENRINICNEFGNYLINKTDAWSKEEWSDILKNNLFYLNIHRRINCKSFEAFRIIPILANGGVIFSERCNTIEELEYKNYNIIFTERDNLYNTFIKYKENIDYDDIFDKTLLFRNALNEKIII